MLSRFFIDRPIFASVLSIFATLAGLVSLFSLPIAQYPEITPPTVEVAASYPGANARVVAATVAAPIEQQVNGVEGMLYMSSQCANDGSYTLTITFEHGVDLDIAQVLVQNRVALAQPTLPPLVQRNGVSIKKKAPGTLMIVNLHSPDGSKDDLFLSNYATIQIRDELARLPGVGDIAYIGQRDYSMRLWLDPDRMAARKVTPGEVTRAVETQNTQVAAGQIGQPPLGTGPAFQLTMSTLGRLMEADQFANLVVKTDAQGRLVRLRDVAEIEMGAQGYEQSCTLDGKPSVALTVHQLPGSNALETARLVRARMEELAKRFPEGIAHEIVYDTSPFIEESIREVFRTLLEAVALVALVILLFLGDWRAAVIPLLAVPVAVVGTFAAMLACGYSLNTLTLFGLVLAIGIVVDDAIVVVEAVEHELGKGLAPREATIRAMEQVAGPVLAVGLVLSAVFVPCLFIGGISGQFFRQFALTIAVSTLLSAFNSLTLSPALAALLLRPGAEGHTRRAPLPRLAFPVAFALAAWWFAPAWLAGWVPLPAGVPGWVVPAACAAAGVLLGWLVAKPLNAGLGQGFAWFNRAFGWLTRGYTLSVRGLLKIPLLVLAGYGALVWLTARGFEGAPKGFIPEQDKGYLLVNLQLPDASSLGRTRAAVLRMEQAALGVPGVKNTVAVAGRSALLEANAPHFGAMYVLLEPFEKRKGRALGAEAIARELTRTLEGAVPEGQVTVLGAPPVDGLGNAGGFRLVLEDRGEVGLAGLQEIADRVVARAAEDPLVEGAYSSLRADTPWVHLDIDRVQAQSMGVPIGEILDALQMYLGSFYINDFNRFGRTWQVIAQAGSKARQSLEDLRSIRVQSTRGEMVPLATLVTSRQVGGPALVLRHNLFPAAPLTFNAAPGVSSGQAIDRMGELAKEEQAWSMRSEWTELAYLQQETGGTATVAFGLGVALVFLVLAAQYESWALPMAVILVVPLCLSCALAGVWLTRTDINIFTQIGFVVLIGLACKNAILIVEFARARRDAGASRLEATLEACALRLRPIVMTSLAFIIGVAPLLVAQGAGAEMRRILGIAVFSGMLGVTLFGVFLTPVFYFVIDWAAERVRGKKAAG
jgi:multidrug efflux pump subunit AcrB